VGAHDKKHTRKMRCIGRSGLQSGGKLTGFATFAELARPKREGKMAMTQARKTGPHENDEKEELFPTLRRAGARIDYEVGERICSQDDPCAGVHYIEEGLVKLSTVSRSGRGAVLGFLWKGDFFGEACLTGRERHQISAVALSRTSVIFIKTRSMMRLIERDPAVAGHLVKHLLERNRRIEEDLLDHIFNTSERRLARTLLWLSQHGKRRKTPSILDKINQDTLADIVGTTRPRVNYFMNKFRRLGLIQYEGPGVVVHPALQEFLQSESSDAG
jgi:CRP/FNR family cyclic AMP-dependent transcriptional regulator